MKDVSNTQKVIKGISSQTLVVIVLGGVEIISFAIMSRLLTKEDFGYYAAITAITTVFATFSETGIGSAIIQKQKPSSNYINNAFTLSLIFGFAVSFSLFLCSGLLSAIIADSKMETPLKLMSVTLILNCLTSVNTSIMYKKLQFLKVGLINLVSLIITTGIAIFLAVKGMGYYAIIVKAVLYSIIVFVLSFVLCGVRFSITLEKEKIKSIINFSGWLMASNLFRNLSHQVDRLLMPNLLSVYMLGAYNRPKEFVEQISSKFNGIFDTALFPVLSGIQDDVEKLRNAYRRSMFYINIFSFSLSLLFFFNSELIIRLFFGKEWMELKSITMILSGLLIFNIDGRLADCYLRSLALTKQQFYFRIFEASLNTLGVLIGFLWGITGVAVSFLISNSIAKLIKITYIGRKICISPSESINIIFSSWKIGFFVIPILLIANHILNSSLIGNIEMAFISVVTFGILFIFAPRIVGQRYRTEIHARLIKQLKIEKLFKRIR